jgi:hypothetical protein
MPRRIDVATIRRDATVSVAEVMARLNRVESLGFQLDDLRWSYCMSLVELHAIWERFAERRLVAALNQHPSHFLTENSVYGITKIPAGLAVVLVRGGKFFDFRSFGELLKRGKALVSTSDPFLSVARGDRDHLDSMSAIRNQVVHHSDASWLSYKRNLRSLFNISYAPSPGEFLGSVDRRAASPLRGELRIRMFAHVVSNICAAT